MRLDVAHDAGEVEVVAIPVVVARRLHGDRHADRGNDTRLAEVNHRSSTVDQELVLGAESWNRVGVEPIVEAHAGLARSGLGAQPLHAGPELGDLTGPGRHTGLDAAIL